MTTKEIRKIEPTGVINADPVTPITLVQMAIDQNADLDRLEKLMGMQERWEANQAKKAYVSAMAYFKAKCPEIEKTKEVDYTSSKGRTQYMHAGLAETIVQIKDLLREYEFSHSWRTSQTPEGLIRVTCIVTHVEGHSEETTMMAAPDPSGGKNSIQALGSTVTYLERYTLFAILGLASKDQDNDTAMADVGFEGDVLAAFASAKDKKELQKVWAQLNNEQKSKYRKDLDLRLGEL